MKKFSTEGNQDKKPGDEGYDDSKLGKNDEVTLLPVLVSILNGQDASNLDGDKNVQKHADFTALAKKEDLQEQEQQEIVSENN